MDRPYRNVPEGVIEYSNAHILYGHGLNKCSGVALDLPHGALFAHAVPGRPRKDPDGAYVSNVVDKLITHPKATEDDLDHAVAFVNAGRQAQLDYLLRAFDKEGIDVTTYSLGMLGEIGVVRIVTYDQFEKHFSVIPKPSEEASLAAD